MSRIELVCSIFTVTQVHTNFVLIVFRHSFVPLPSAMGDKLLIHTFTLFIPRT